LQFALLWTAFDADEHRNGISSGGCSVRRKPLSQNGVVELSTACQGCELFVGEPLTMDKPALDRACSVVASVHRRCPQNFKTAMLFDFYR
jgi:hypothetical protein